MLTPDLIRLLLPALMGLPIVAALVLRFTSGTRSRGLALAFAIVHLALTALVVVSGLELIQDDPNLSLGIKRQEKKLERVFAPQFVPGDPMPDGRASYSTTNDILPIYGPNPSNPHERVKIAAAQFFIGLDGLNVWLVALGSFLMFPVVLISWDTVHEREGSYYAWLFLLQAGLLGVFLSFDILLFYVCFELTLVPLLFLIGGWGPGPNRREAARKLFLFTLAGGLITLLGVAGTVLYVYERTQIGGGHGELTFSIPRLADLVQTGMLQKSEASHGLWRDAQTYLFLALAVGFAVKIPLVPLHSWLPGAYSEAPIGVTVMLSALLAKMGTFGLLRICMPLCPDATLAVGMPLIGVLAVIAIIYGALCAYAQTDIRRLVAYSSVSHLGFCVLALMAFSPASIAGGLLHMVNHGLSTGAMFLLVGMLVRRYGTAQIADYSGMWSRLPVLTFFMMVACLASIGLPGLNNFVSEMLMLGGVLDARNVRIAVVPFTVLAALGIFLSAWYTLTMVRRVFFGPIKEPPTAQPVTDLTGRERLTIVPVVVLCLVLGLFVQPVLDVMYRDVGRLAQIGDEARARATK
ncbi:MAG TPA: NADH-quinone oxidoreductase subunit M [Gemmataceae bacterium]|jgi:NADH-quinone oxidoreductase subunit M|nr:NADH-quinone oxidoreductase subunit M [Gemmataceae bacterium]